MTIRRTLVRYGSVTPDFEADLIHGSKLGGWPSHIQSELWWERGNDDGLSFAFQIASESEAGWMWRDDGTAYFARSQRDPRKWTFDVQCY